MNENFLRIGLMLLFAYIIYHFLVKRKGNDSILINEPPTLPLIPQITDTGNGKTLEVHFVFAEWCGHSQRAVPEFQKLVQNTSSKTSSGVPIKLVMTEESGPGIKQFKEHIQGFPTYMYIKKENGNVIRMDELEVQSRSSEDILSAAKEL